MLMPRGLKRKKKKNRSIHILEKLFYLAMDDHPAVILRLMLCDFLEIKSLLFLFHTCYCS